MNLHEHKKDFKELISIVANEMNLSEIETLLLENGYTYQGQNNHGEESYINAEGYEVGITYMDFFGSYSIAIYVYPPVAA